MTGKKRPAKPVRAIPVCWTWPEPSRTEIREALANEGAQWMLMRDWHDGRCAICGRCRHRLVQDHDHDTALIRGWLCDQCNIQEGYRYGGAIAMYRECSPAVILGFRIVYIDPVTRIAAVPKPVLTPEEEERRFQYQLAEIDRAFAGIDVGPPPAA